MQIFKRVIIKLTGSPEVRAAATEESTPVATATATPVVTAATKATAVTTVAATAATKATVVTTPATANALSLCESNIAFLRLFRVVLLAQLLNVVKETGLNFRFVI